MQVLGRAAGVDCGSFGFWGFTAEALEPLGVDSGCSVLCFEASMDCPSEFAALALEMTRIWSIAEGFHQCFLGGLQPSFAISHIHADYLGRLYKILESPCVPYRRLAKPFRSHTLLIPRVPKVQATLQVLASLAGLLLRCHFCALGSELWTPKFPATWSATSRACVLVNKGSFTSVPPEQYSAVLSNAF